MRCLAVAVLRGLCVKTALSSTSSTYSDSYLLEF